MTTQTTRAREKPVEPAAGPAQIMIVDDDDDLRASVARLFTASGFGVDAFGSAAEALLQLHRGLHPDLILLDLLMPDMNGWQFRIAQKRERSAADALVVVCSADLSEQALAIDADAFLPKPLEARVLLDTVERLISTRSRQRASARVSELDRLRSLGELAGGIAHEVNNPLAAVVGNLELAQKHAEKLAGRLAGAGESADLVGIRDLLSRAQHGADRVTDVVRSVAMFAHADTTSATVLNVQDVLESSLQVASNQIRHCARLERHYNPVPLVVGNAAQLGQVFLNLLLNAVHNIRAQGAGEHRIDVRTDTDELGDVVVTVSGTGRISEFALRASIFDPCFAINDQLSGLGFGLAVSRELVNVMGGTMEIESEQDAGSCVRVRMPSAVVATIAAPKPQLAPPVATTPAARGPAKLLVVDDEPMICELVSAMLEDAYEVSAFTDSRAALAAILAGAFDVILCDLMMPELTGMELYQRVEAERPDIAQKFIFISGGAFADDALDFLASTTRPQLKKPFRRADLVGHVEALLDRDASSRAHA